MSNQRIYKVKNAPKPVQDWFNAEYPPSDGFEFRFYWYLANEQRYYGCAVMKDGKLWTNSHQGRTQDFADDQPTRIKERGVV